MQRVRKPILLARLVLAWFALFIVVAAASPIVKPMAIELICSGSGAIKALIKGDDGTGSTVSHTLDCPLCAALDAPPSELAQAGVQAHPLSGALDSLPAPHIARLTSAPLPARGPPALS